MGVIRMGLPTASFLPGCHMVESRKGTREVSQSGSRGKQKDGDLRPLEGSGQD